MSSSTLPPQTPPLDPAESRRALEAAQGAIKDLKSDLKDPEGPGAPQVVKKYKLLYSLKRTIALLRKVVPGGEQWPGKGDKLVEMRENKFDESLFLKEANYLRDGLIYDPSSLDNLNEFCQSGILEKMEGGIDDYLKGAPIHQDHKLEAKDFTESKLYGAIRTIEDRKKTPKSVNLARAQEVLQESKYCLESTNKQAIVGFFETLGSLLKDAKFTGGDPKIGEIGVALKEASAMLHGMDGAGYQQRKIQEFKRNRTFEKLSPHIEKLRLAAVQAEKAEAAAQAHKDEFKLMIQQEQKKQDKQKKGEKRKKKKDKDKDKDKSKKKKKLKKNKDVEKGKDKEKKDEDDKDKDKGSGQDKDKGSGQDKDKGSGQDKDKGSGQDKDKEKNQSNKKDKSKEKPKLPVQKETSKKSDEEKSQRRDSLIPNWTKEGAIKQDTRRHHTSSHLSEDYSNSSSTKPKQ